MSDIQMNRRLELNREYAMRHIGVALLFAALCAWSVYDGAIGWPAKNAEWEKTSGFTVQAACEARANKENLPDEKKPPHWPEKITAQYYQAGVLGLVSLVVALGVLSAKKKTLEWNESEMCGTLTGGKSIKFTEVKALDKTLWEKKRILKVHTNNGVITLDGWHHTGVTKLAEKLGVS